MPVHRVEIRRSRIGALVLALLFTAGVGPAAIRCIAAAPRAEAPPAAAPPAAAPPAAAQGMPPPIRIESLTSPHNRNRVLIKWEPLPEHKEKKLPDGSTEAPRAPFPFLLFVKDVDSREAQKVASVVFGDARITLASNVVKFVQITPDKAIELPYLKSVSGIKDPSLVVLDRDFKVVGIVNEWKNFDEKGVLPVLVKAADAAYPMKLAAWLAAMAEILEQAEKTWKQEERVAELQRKAGGADPARQKALDEECDRIEKEAEETNAALAEKEAELKALMVAKEPEAEALPTTFGSGRSKRKLTPQELEAIASFREFARNENPIVRAAAVEDLGAIDSGAMVEFILAACNDVDPRVVEAAGRALGRMKSDEALGGMLAGLDHGNSKARAAATFGFAHVKRSYPAAVPKILAVLRTGDDDLRRAAIQALANMKDPATTDALLEALGDRVPALRVIAAEALGELKAGMAAPALLEQVETAGDWSLQKAAVEALAKIRSRDSIEPLIARLEAEEGVIVEALYKALVAITGQDFSDDAKFWRRWWDRAKADFKLPTDEEIAKARERIAAAKAKYSRPGKSTYHTIETLSKRIIFVVDVSSSMGDKITIPDSARKEEVEAFGTRVKMEIAKNELIAMLGSIGDDVQFNIITFSNSARPWQDGLVGASMRTTAIKFVSKLQPVQAPSGSGRAAGPVTGGEEQKTNTYGALLAAFGFADEGAPDWKKRSKADTIFFVTDGLPTTGQIVDVPKMIDAVTEMNRTRGLVIHLVMFDPIAAERLSGLARRNGGQCVVRGFVEPPAGRPPAAK
jgi:HEAT repeat protein